MNLSKSTTYESSLNNNNTQNVNRSSPSNFGLERTTSYGRKTISHSLGISSPPLAKTPEQPKKNSEDLQSSTKEYLNTLRNTVSRSRILTGNTPGTSPQVAPREPRKLLTQNINENPGDSENKADPDVKQLKSDLATANMINKLQSDELATLKAAMKKLEAEKLGKNSTATGGTRTLAAADDSSADEIKNLKKKILLITQRAQTAEQSRDQLLQKWSDFEQEKIENFRIFELAEQTYQILQSQNTKYAAEIEIYKQQQKSTPTPTHSANNNSNNNLNNNNNALHLSSLRKLQDENSALQGKLDEVSAELEKEKTEKTKVIDELKAKITSLETNAKATTLSQRLQSLPSHPKKELTDARAELATKDRKIAQLETTLSELQSKSALLIDQLNRMCDEVEQSENIYLKLDTSTKENETLKQENSLLSTEIQTIKDELIRKENEITVLLDDNDKMVAQLVDLGYKVQVEDDYSLKIIPINSTSTSKTPPTTASQTPVKTPSQNNSNNHTDIPKKPTSSKIPEDLAGLSIDELLNG